jgi:hypothetical protein
VDCVVRVTASQDAVEPPALLGNRQLSSIPKFLAYGFQLGFLSLGDTPAAYRKRSGFRLGAEVGEPEEVERPRFSVSLPLTSFGGEPSELQKSRFILVQVQRELGQPVTQSGQESFRIVLMLTTDHEVVRIPHHDHFSAGVALAPMLHPQI